MCSLWGAKMERVSEVLQLPVIVEGRRPRVLEPQLLEKLDFLRSRGAAEGRILKEFLEPGSSPTGGSDSRSTNSNRFACPGTTRWFKTISRPNVARSISQDSISGSKNETQFSADTWKMSVSRNASTATRISA